MDSQHLRQLTESVRNAIVRVNTQWCPDSTYPESFECHEFSLPGGLTVYDISIDPIIIKREASHIAEDSKYDYFLTTQLQGMATIQQGDTSFDLVPGEIGLMSSSLPYSVEYKSPSRRLIIRIPGKVFRDRLLSREQVAPLGHLPNEGIGRVVVDLLKSVASQAGSLAVTEQYTLVQSLLELTGALIRASLKTESMQKDTRHAGLLNRIYAYLADNYIDCDLTPEKIAQANGISTRHLHRLFSESGTTVQKWIWEQRLMAARNDLLDPSQSRTRISDIAFRQGFNDMAHFSRTFRNRFGISPSQLRNLALTPAVN